MENRVIFKYSGMLLILTAFILFLSSCTTVVRPLPPGKSTPVQPRPGVGSQRNEPPPWAPAHGYRAKHRYRYYNDAQIYYDVDRRVYFYYRNGQWQISVTFPTRVHIDMDRYIVLEMDSDKPYRYHQDVMKKYPPGQMKKDKKGNRNKKRP